MEANVDPNLDAVLAIREVGKSFGSIRALDGAGFILRQGEWLGLLGPNGAGKSTIVRAVAGRVRLDRGTVSLLGETIGPGRAAVRRRLGIVGQEIALYPTLTARENLFAFGRLHGVREGLDDRVGWALDWTGLAPRSGDLVKRFSGGMKRRLNIAAAVLHRPEVILLDEPTVGVDPQSRERIWQMLETLRADGASLLLTTHQLDEAQSVCDRIVIIDRGRTIADGTLAELYTRVLGGASTVNARVEGVPAAAALGEGMVIDGDTVRMPVDDPARDVPAMLAAIGRAGGRVTALHMETPSLHAVFLELTGRELRE